MPLHTLFFTQLLQHGRIPGADSERIVIRVAWGHYVMATMMLSVAGCPIEPAFELEPAQN